jgi:pentatricopeptide repeat protein
MGIAFSKAQMLYQLPGGEEWETLVEFLSQDKFHLGFLRREGNYLLTETAYLDYIVAPDGEKNIVQTIVENFSEEERLRLGLIVTSYNFGEVFRQSPPKNETDLEKLVRKIRPLGLEREIQVWNQLLNLCPTLQLARRAMDMLRNVGVASNVITYNTLIAKAQDYESARAVVEEMKEAGVVPEVITYNTLIAKAQDYESARAVIEEMKEAGVVPEVITYNTLIAKAQDYESARAVIEEMKEAGVAPNVLTFSALFTKNLSLVNADDLLAWYLNQPYHPEGPMEAAIKSYRRMGIVGPALFIALNYPHLAAARKLVRENEESALRYFQSFISLDPSNGNGYYALGITLIEVNRGLEAVPYLEKALTLASIRDQSSPRVKYIKHLLHSILDGTPANKAPLATPTVNKL